MKKIIKLLIFLGLLLGLFACIITLPTEEDSIDGIINGKDTTGTATNGEDTTNTTNTTKASVRFTMQNIANSTSNVTPSKVAISYKKSGETQEFSTIIELATFGNSYITNKALSLDKGTYKLTKFDVLNDSGKTIYFTPRTGSEIANNLNISTALDYSFSVVEGNLSTIMMQVVEVSETKGSVKFTMQNIANSANSNILFSSTDEQTPNKVAISYKKSGETQEFSTIIELTAFGSSYITNEALSLDKGTYKLTKFDVLNDSGRTIYSTPRTGSEVASNLSINTALDYSFSVVEGNLSTILMQVVEVSDTTDPADFGHAAFTFELADYNKFYMGAILLDEASNWIYTTAQVNIANAENTTIKIANISGEMNKIIVANSESYIITISKNGYATQKLSFTKAELKAYENKALIVKLKTAS